MPFDPTLPANGSQIRSAELRSQFSGLKDLIDTGDAAALRQPSPPAVDLAGRQLLDANGSVVLDWSHGALRLPEYSTIPDPAPGSIAYDYEYNAVMYFNGEWFILGPTG